MPLTPGTRIGHYEILAQLGAGGMGEVYRARDTRLMREVAIKVLPAELAGDPERRARFEAEWRIIAALSHPNLLALHDVGSTDAFGYAVMELIEGQTLRERLAEGPLPAPRASTFAMQIAQGLAAAHDRGIVHRDLKPENVILTPDGRIKLLDFGLARREELATAGSGSMAPTMAYQTEPGAVLGTVAYMSPEQVRGQQADARSDLFALGIVLYEMLAGARPFTAESAAETMTAILREEPAELSRHGRDVPPALEHIVRRCLEKLPAARFRSAADLAYALEAVGAGSSGSHAPLAAGTAPTKPRFKRITFRNGMVAGARFVPDGTGVVFGAAWEGRPFEVFTALPGSPEARSLGLPPANLLSISASGEMALSLGYRHFFWNQAKGTLARNALGGGGVRPLQKDVVHADWSPDGKSLALIRYVDGTCRLEYPAGQTRCETPGWMNRPRVSRDGRMVAFSQHIFQGDTSGRIVLLDAAGSPRTLVDDMASVSGIAWSPSGDEVWYSGIDAAQQNGIWGVSLDGRVRDVFGSPARVSLHDVALDGRVLIGLGNLRLGMSVSRAPGEAEFELSWFDGTVATDITSDGRAVLFTEGHEAENPYYACYLRDIDGSPAVRLGEGTSTRLSADGQWALAVTVVPRQELMAYPVGIGEPRAIPIAGIERIMWAGSHPDGKHIFVVGTNPDRANRLYLTPAGGGTPTLLWDEAIASSRIAGPAISADGERVAVHRVSGGHVLVHAATRVAEPLTHLTDDDDVLLFDPAGDHVYVVNGDAAGRRVERVSLATGERTPWRTLAPPDRTGVFYLGAPALSADGRTMAYSYYRHIADLYVVEGLG
jgi:hypothetical protein